MKIRHRLFIVLQHLLPQLLLSRMMYSVARWSWAPWKNTLIKRFIKLYQVDMSLAQIENIRDYPHFNAFFTRELKPGTRPIDQSESQIVSPVDGAVSQIGKIQDQSVFQAKGKTFELATLLADDELAQYFKEGDFATIYLSPRDYHRIHMPIAGQLEKMIYIPGKLFSVNTITTEAVEQLFARNERVVCLFNTAIGKLALIMVGAIFVGSMETVWAGQITPNKNRRLQVYDYGPDKPELKLSKGEEMGRFNMGSTVILLFQSEKMRWNEQLQAGSKVELGKKLGVSKQ